MFSINSIYLAISTLPTPPPAFNQVNNGKNLQGTCTPTYLRFIFHQVLAPGRGGVHILFKYNVAGWVDFVRDTEY